MMLASIIGLYVQSARAGEPSYLLSTLSELDFGTATGRWLFIGFMFAFAIKAPLVPLHTWLPDAAEESTAGGATMMVQRRAYGRFKLDDPCLHPQGALGFGGTVLVLVGPQPTSVDHVLAENL